MLSIDTARWLLIAHAITGGAATAAATHWVVWLWPLWRGRTTRARGMRRFAVITMALYVLAMVIGLVLYPTYKAHVKLEYLTRPSSVIGDAADRAIAHDELNDRAAARPPRPVDLDRARQRAGDATDRTKKVARWFDVKEHWVAVGLLLGLGVMAVVLVWKPSSEAEARDGPVAFIVLGALIVAAILWLAVIVGLATSATRSFG